MIDEETRQSSKSISCEEEGIMAKSFVEIKLFQVKPDKTEQFEAMADRMSAEQAKWDGCISIRYSYFRHDCKAIA